MKGKRTPWRRRKEGQSQSTEGNWIREGYSHPEDHKVKDKSAYKKKARGTYTLETAKGQVRIRKENDRERRTTHPLEIAEGGKNQDKESGRERATHSLKIAEGG